MYLIVIFTILLSLESVVFLFSHIECSRMVFFVWYLRVKLYFLKLIASETCIFLYVFSHMSHSDSVCTLGFCIFTGRTGSVCILTLSPRWPQCPQIGLITFRTLYCFCETSVLTYYSLRIHFCIFNNTKEFLLCIV